MRQKGLAPIVIVLIIAAVLGGYFIYQNQNKSSTLPQQTSQSTPDSTHKAVDLKKYINSDYGFEISYPADWTIKEDNQGDFIPLTMRFKAPKSDSLVDIMITNQSLEEWKRTYRYEIMDDTQFNGMPALWATNKDLIGNREGGTYVVTTPKDTNRIVLITWFSDPTDPRKKNVEILKQIISTFKFQ